MTVMLKLYGLSRPYDVTRAMPFSFAVCLFVLVVAVGTVLAFTYVAVTLLLAVGNSVLPRLAWCVLTIAMLELALSATTHVLAMADLGRRLFPENIERRARFLYHPMLQITPVPNFVETGTARRVRHNDYGLRSAPIPEAKRASVIVVAVLGGSTTYESQLSDGSTWPAVLERNLGPRYLVLNFGVPGYSAAEHVIQTAFYLNKTGLEPRCAVYYIGWNDIRNSHVPTLDDGYADFHLLSQVGNFQRRREGRAVRVSPRLTIFFRETQQYFDTVPLPPRYENRPPAAEIDRHLERIYRRNIRSILALNHVHNVRTIFVGQVLNQAKFTADKAYGWLPFMRDKDVPDVMRFFNDALLDESTRLQAPAVVLDLNDFSGVRLHRQRPCFRSRRGQVCEQDRPTRRGSVRRSLTSVRSILDRVLVRAVPRGTMDAFSAFVSPVCPAAYPR